ncbi:hypothetical protein GA0074695_2931 [Micromonospora viridifaciens]|uniref:Uncharacterized protein n=1 Tax=Micromonospora viridifaciens TaxID=1881 RepID=A0A1C4X1K6_MICVI|nr:hypothetical protein [Micromonospora viridifaciens]SCF02377.1 hypothetical protein GA0074695_2931 [Micromonospora viridifaciens]
MTRMEPNPRSGGIEDGLAARVHDPLWLLARQWQLGEFRADDAGSPAFVDVTGETHCLDGWRAGAAGVWQPWDVAAAPIERLVEQENADPATDPRLRLDGGVRWLRTLAQVPQARAAFLAACAWPPPAPGLAARGLTAAVLARSPDGAQVARSLRLLLADGTADAEAARLGLDAAARAHVTAAAPSWLAWWDGHAPHEAQPPASTAPVTWDPHRMEHTFSLRASSLPDVELVAPRYTGGRLDWPTVDVAPPSQAPSNPARPTPLTLRGVPGPARFGGMPAQRFWEMEDAQFDAGAVDAAPHDVARLLLVAFATVYGNDWCVVPVRMPVGALIRITALTVTDVFGRSTMLGPAAAIDPAWNLFALTDDLAPGGSSPWFLLAPALPDSLEGQELESVLLARDEMANLAWAVELRVPDAAGEAADRYDSWAARPRPAPAPSPIAHYRVDTDVPDFWYPLAPEQPGDSAPVRLRLVPLARQLGGRVVEELPLGCVLEESRLPGDPLWLHEEEVPRSGVRISRRCQRARWHDGSVHTWTARRRGAGAGESSSGLVFDTVEPPTA